MEKAPRHTGSLVGNGIAPEPIRDRDGAPILGPQNVPAERANPDLLTPPQTDSGTVPNLKFSFADAHNRLLSGGWAREVTIRELPIATELAGVNMRLKPGGVREMHWHKEAEWAYMLAGRARITAVDQEGRNFIDDVGEGDIWNFPAGIPHSIQGLQDGCEFLLVFDDGDFSENETFLITDWFKHTPRDVLAKNFGLPKSAFADLPVDIEHERYIFPARIPGAIDSDAVRSPAGVVPQTFSHRLMAQEPVEAAGGTARIVDSSNFAAASTIAAALVEVDPGAIRELHWHPNTDEWQYYISGRGSMTVFASGEKARTFDYQAGDVGYIPFAMGHYVENIGDEPLRFLEMFRSDHFADVSLNQWMALTPRELVQAHLNLDLQTTAALSKEKSVVVASRPAQRELEVLPDWPAETIAVLGTGGDAPYSIPVTAPVRAGDRRILLSLNRNHASLGRLRERAQVALAILAAGDDAFTARGRASVVQEPMARAPQFAAVLIEVDHLDDHRQPAELVDSGVGVTWTNENAEQSLRERVDALSQLARGLQ
jgi:oxalate decarboxylase